MYISDKTIISEFLQEQRQKSSDLKTNNKNIMKTRLIPFDIEKAKAGAKVVTRDEREVEIVKWNMGKDFPILGVIGDDVYRWHDNGRWSNIQDEVNKDLFIQEEIKSVVPDSWEDLKEVKGWWIDMYSEIEEVIEADCRNDNKNLFVTENQAKKALAMAQLSQLMKATGDCEIDWSDYKKKYCIIREGNDISTSYSYHVYLFLSFNTESIRDEFMEKHMDLIRTYFELD